MYRHETITPIVGLVLFAALGLIYWDLSRRVETVAATGRDTAERVDSIAQAMPHLGERMALEEIHRELTGAVAITRPLEQIRVR